MPKFVRTIRRAGMKNTREHDIAQVFTTGLIALAVSPYGFMAIAIALFLIALVRAFNNV